MKHIGMRTIKTAIAVFICIIISNLINTQYPFFASIAAIITMQNSVVESFNTGKIRILGTSLGALIGLILVLILPYNPLLCAIGIIIVIYLCNLLGWKDSIVIACIVLVSIMTGLHGKNPYIYSIFRLLEAFVGICIALLVNYIIYPPKYLYRISESSNALVDKIFILTGKKLCYGEKINITEIRDELRKLDNWISVYEKESKLKSDEIIKVDKVKKTLDLCGKIFIHLRIVNLFEWENCLTEENFTRIIKLYNAKMDNQTCTTEQNSIVYNFHVEKILNELEQLSTINLSRSSLSID